MNRIFINNVIHEEKNVFYESVDKIWGYAETSLNEYESMETLIEMLENEEFQIHRKLGEIDTAFKAEYGVDGVNIGLLAEYDALPGMSQESDFSKKQKKLDNDNGHACGHNLIGVGVCGAAIAIKKFLKENKLAGKITVFGCPAEETSSGKSIMAKKGCFDELDLAITWHPFSHGVVIAGKTLATAQIKFKFSGKSSHAALAPHLGRSALDSVELMNIGSNYLREHVPEGVKFHYAITNSGGIAPNIIPEFAEVVYLIRANDSKTLYEVVERIKNIAKGSSLMTETSVDIEIEKGCLEYLPNKKLGDILFENMKNTLTDFDFSKFIQEQSEIRKTLSENDIESDIRLLKIITGYDNADFYQELKSKILSDVVIPNVVSQQVIPASTDVGDISQIVPTAQFFMPCYTIGTQGHSWQQTAQSKSPLAKEMTLNSAKIIANSSIDIFENNELFLEILKEWRK